MFNHNETPEERAERNAEEKANYERMMFGQVNPQQHVAPTVVPQAPPPPVPLVMTYDHHSVHGGAAGAARVTQVTPPPPPAGPMPTNMQGPPPPPPPISELAAAPSFAGQAAAPMEVEGDAAIPLPPPPAAASVAETRNELKQQVDAALADGKGAFPGVGAFYLAQLGTQAPEQTQPEPGVPPPPEPGQHATLHARWAQTCSNEVAVLDCIQVIKTLELETTINEMCSLLSKRRATGEAK